jgi:regulator of protease activity HflC (stomatin/prohibitin superfamily)
MQTSTPGKTNEGVALIDAVVAVAILLVAVVVILASFAQVGRGGARVVERVERGIEVQNETLGALPAARAGRDDLR